MSTLLLQWSVDDLLSTGFIQKSVPPPPYLDPPRFVVDQMVPTLIRTPLLFGTAAYIYYSQYEIEGGFAKKNKEERLARNSAISSNKRN